MARTLGIDLGSSAVKVVMLDPSDGIVAEASAPNDIDTPHPGWAEADPAQWWRNVVECTRRVTAVAGADDVVAIAVSGMVPAVVVLDDQRQPIRRALLQNDARAAAELASLRERLGDVDLLATTGSMLTQQSVAPTLLWMARHEPDAWKRVRTVLGSYDWLASQLGADLHVERNWAIESGIFDLGGELVGAVIDAVGADGTLFPPVRDGGEQVGALSTAAADQLGLPAGTPLVVAGADHVLSAYAAGLSRPGEMLIKLGGAGDILVVASSALLDARLYLDRHPAPGLWMSNGCMATSGTLLRWFQREVARGVPIEMLDADAAASPPGANDLVCLPYLLGEKSPLHDPNLRGAFFGLHLGTTRGDLFRACLEAVAYAFRHHLDIYAELGFTPGTARVSNGGSRSRLWKQILADVCGITLQPVVGHLGASLGAAIVASVGVGELSDWTDARRFVSLAEPIDPEPGLRDRYTHSYDIFRQATEIVAPIAHQLARAS